MKKKSGWIVLGIIVLLIPTVIAAINYVVTKDSPISSGSVSRVTLQLPYDGEEKDPETFVFDPAGSKVDLNNIGNNMVGYFTKVTELSKEVPELPEELKGIPHYTVTFINYNRPVEYKFYYIDQPGFCYYTDANEKCFNIPEDYARAFLLSVYGMKVFDTADIPVASTPSVEFIDPVSITWSYLTIDNLYPKYTETNDKAYTDTVYTFAETLSLTYTNCVSDPKTQTVDVLDEGGSSIYSGSLEEMAHADIPKNEVIDVQLTAAWARTDEKACEGTLVYRFKCKITDAPEFEVVTKVADNTVEAGDFFCITVKNAICEPKNIKVTFEPEIESSPVFHADGNSDRALVAIPYDTAAGTLTVTVDADGIKHSEKITVEDYRYLGGDAKPENFTSDVLTGEVQTEFDENMSEVLTSGGDKIYFDGPFIYPFDGCSDDNLKSGFGKEYIAASGHTYFSNWVRYEAAKGTEILAMNAGKVVYVGEQTMTGKTVVIDHGLGLMSIYASLDEVNVKQGDELKQGDVIGTLGNGGYTDGTRCSVAFAVDGQYVCPYNMLFDDVGIVIEKE